MKIHGQLTHRQQEVLTHLESGASLDEVATRLSIAPSTVKTHLSNIYSLVKVRSRYELAAQVRADFAHLAA